MVISKDKACYGNACKVNAFNFLACNGTMHVMEINACNGQARCCCGSSQPQHFDFLNTKTWCLKKV
jgi:hypothetical protein